MSYSFAVKQALADIKLPVCCRRSQLLGFLFYFSDSTLSVRFTSAHEDLFEKAVSMIRSVCAVEGKTSKTEGGTFRFSADERESEILYDTLTSDPLPERKECCLVSFVRGCFLAGGFIADPTTRFHLEIRVRSDDSADLLQSVIRELDLPFRRSSRGGKPLFYMKKSDDIGDFLAVMGLRGKSFEYLNANIEKDIINTVNRQMNCETGNINKIVLASKKQIEAIDFFMSRAFDGLTPPLIAVAKARYDNPSANLSELALLVDPPLSKSGLAHRLNRIIALYEQKQLQ